MPLTKITFIDNFVMWFFLVCEYISSESDSSKPHLSSLFTVRFLAMLDNQNIHTLNILLTRYHNTYFNWLFTCNISLILLFVPPVVQCIQVCWHVHTVSILHHLHWLSTLFSVIILLLICCCIFHQFNAQYSAWCSVTSWSFTVQVLVVNAYEVHTNIYT